MARKKVTFALIGGFLGAGKTTTLCEVAKQVAASGKRVGVITNDQATDLVDTGMAKLDGLPVSEIAGGCFCCKFDSLVAAAEEILDAIDPDVLLAEPVGSCTDLSATVLQPLKQYYGDWFSLLPYSVLVDPDRVESTLLGPQKDSDIGYLFRKQLEEADVIVLNKADKLAPARREQLVAALKEAFPGIEVQAFSALTGEGVESWWQAVQGGGIVGQRLLEVDYDTYAAAEAALGWLNATVSLRAAAGFDAAALGRDMLEALRAASKRANAEIGHIKLLLNSAAGSVRSALVDGDGAVDETVRLTGPCTQATLTLNARVTLSPEDLEQTVREAVASLAARHGVTAEVERLQSFRPGRPNPTHRFSEVVAA